MKSNNVCLVIIPTYNAQNYIADTLESILSQSGNVKVIVSDDHSSDNTLKIVSSLGKKNIFITKTNREGNNKRTASVARNAGLKYYLENEESLFNDVEFLTFVDHDDILAKNSISIRVEKLLSEKADFLYSNLLNFSEEKKAIQKVDRVKVEGLNALLVYTAVRNINYNTMIYSKRLIAEMVEARQHFGVTTSLLFDEDLTLHEDRDVACLAINTCYKKGYSIAFAPEYTYFHREHVSLSSNIPSSVKLNNYRCVDYRYLNRLTFFSAVIQRIIDRPTYRFPRKVRKLKVVKDYESNKYKRMDVLSDQEYQNLILWFK